MGTKKEWADRAAAAREQGDWDAALNLWDAFRRRYPQSQRAWIGQGELLLELERFPQAEELFAEMVRRFPDSAAGLEGLARTAAAQGEWSRCVRLARTLLGRDPTAKAGHRWLITGLQALGRDDESVAAATLATALPEFPLPWEVLLDHAWARGDLARIGRLQEALRACISRPDRLFALQQRITLFSGDYRGLATAAEAALERDPALVSPYTLMFRLCHSEGRYRELLRWAHRLLERQPGHEGAAGAAFEALMQLGHYAVAYALVRDHRRAALDTSVFSWNLLHRYYATRNSTSTRFCDSSSDRHLGRIAKAAVLRFPDRRPLERLIPTADRFPHLQSFLVDQASRTLPDPAPLLFAARSAWLLSRATREVDDRVEEWLALRGEQDPAALLHLTRRGGFEPLDLCRALYMEDNREALAALLQEVRHGDHPPPWRTQAAGSIFDAALHWFRDPGLAREAVRLGLEIAWSRLRQWRDGVEGAIDYLDLVARMVEVRFHEERKPVLPPPNGVPRSSSALLHRILEGRFRPVSVDLEAWIDPPTRQRLRVALRYLARRLTHGRPPAKTVARALEVVRRLHAFGGTLLVGEVLRWLRQVRKLAERSVAEAGPPEAMLFLDLLLRTTAILGFHEGRPGLAPELERLAALAAPPETTPGTPTEAEEQRLIIAAAMRCLAGDERPLLAAREAIARRRGRLEKGIWAGLFDFRRARETLAEAPPAGPPPLPEWVEGQGELEGTGDYLVLVSCDSRYLLRHGWAFLATMNAEAAPGRRHLHLHLVNPSATALDHLRAWEGECPRVALTLSLEERPGCDASYYAMARYGVLEAVQARFRKALLVADIDLYWLQPGLDALATRLAGSDFALYENPSDGTYSFLPWCAVWSGLVYLGDTGPGRAILGEIGASARTLLASRTVRWYIDQNLFFDGLPRWKAMAGDGYRNLRELGVYGGRFVHLERHDAAAITSRYYHVDGVIGTRVLWGQG